MAQMDVTIINPAPRPPPKQRLRVLIAEDDRVLRMMTAKLLEVSGYAVSCCVDGLEAIELIEKQSFDLILTDLIMPGASGIEVLKAARRYQARAMVVMITGSPSPQSLLEAKRQGAYAYLGKPFNIKHLLSILRNAVEQMRVRGSSDKGTKEEERFVESVGNTVLP
jgi:CheY-like chemotaxis protein